MNSQSEPAVAGRLLSGEKLKRREWSLRLLLLIPRPDMILMGCLTVVEEASSRLRGKAFTSSPKSSIVEIVTTSSSPCIGMQNAGSIIEVGDGSAPGAQSGSAAYVRRSIEALFMLGVHRFRKHRAQE